MESGSSSISSISQDASSLRAAALLTLRSKGKRPQSSNPENQVHPQDDNSSVASTRKAPPSPELNYGSDDGLADAEGSTEEEDHEKEEGEISDDEDAINMKHDSTMMEVDSEPVPGLKSSSDRFKDFDWLLNSKETRTSSFEQGFSRPRSNLEKSPLIVSTSGPSRISAPRSPKTLSSPRPDHSSEVPGTLQPGSVSSSIPEPPNKSNHSSATRSISGPSSLDLSRAVNSPITNQPIQPKISSRSPPTAPASFRRSPQPSRPVLDHAHARPSLSLTAQELTEVKTLILDLLGWGVPSEHFINCGLSREAIYYAFSEMNLKLPVNLNTDGIVPYDPPRDYSPDLSWSQLDRNRASQPTPSSTSTPAPQLHKSMHGLIKLGNTTVTHPLPERPKSVSQPTLPSLKGSKEQLPSHSGSRPSYNGNDRVVNGESPSFRHSTSSIPGLSTPPAMQLPSGQSKPSINSQPASREKQSVLLSPVVNATANRFNGNLDEMETLRRQELLARKAVLASRKPKFVASSSTTPTPDPSTSLVKSGPPPTSPTSDKPSISPEAVDNFLLSVTSGSSDGKMSSESIDPPALNRSPEAMDIDIDIQTSLPGRNDDPLYSKPTTFPQRKNSNKRPVASDFVDYDARSPRNRSPRGEVANNGRGRGNLEPRPRFSNLVPSWKVVIDFSDSEDENSTASQEDTGSKNQPSTPSDIPASTSTVTGPSFGRSSNVSPPTTMSPAPFADIITPAVLQAKEEEIKRMKLLIAERESNKLKRSPKAAAPKGTVAVLQPSVRITTSSLNSATEAVQGVASLSSVVQQEETTPSSFTSVSKAERDTPEASNIGEVRDIDPTMYAGVAREPPNVEISSTSTPPSPDVTAGHSHPGVTDEQVLMADAEGEQAASVVPIDVEVAGTNDASQLQSLASDDVSTSMTVDHEASTTQQRPKAFSAYTSPLSSFASFRSPIRLDTTVDNSFTALSSSNSSAFDSSIPSFPLDISTSEQVHALLRPLKETTLLKLDPKRTICQFEIPGAGRCRDPTCQNVHLRALEPNDYETAQYLVKFLPAPGPTVEEIKAALSRVRASSKQDLDYGILVSRVLTQLGVC